MHSRDTHTHARAHKITHIDHGLMSGKTNYMRKHALGTRARALIYSAARERQL